MTSGYPRKVNTGGRTIPSKVVIEHLRNLINFNFIHYHIFNCVLTNNALKYQSSSRVY